MGMGMGMGVRGMGVRGMGVRGGNIDTPPFTEMAPRPSKKSTQVRKVLDSVPPIPS
jgi:hypothetical protein